VIAPCLEDGMVAQVGTVIAQIEGPTRQILAFERTALNVLSRLSGVATVTAEYVRIAAEKAPAGCQHICDTRKTTPGLRALEKYAVRCGGSWLHRSGLFDAMLIKDNHLEHMGAKLDLNQLEGAIARARAGADLRFVELEVDTLEQLERALRLPAGLIDIVLLDNMNPDVIARAIEIRNEEAPSVQLEASGGVTLETVGAIAATGVDRISVGALTHSAPALDIGLDLR
jgi:nicotinate-nucleotide pyrophosphorylase (carboxylating)